MYQDAGLAGTRPGEYQHVGPFAVVGDDAPLRRAQVFDDRLPGLRRGLAGNLGLPVGQPAIQERLPLQAEVVHCQA